MATHMMYPIKSVTTIKPGMMPAMNSLPIAISVSTPQTIISTEGGINMPKQALPAMQPSANLRS